MEPDKMADIGLCWFDLKTDIYDSYSTKSFCCKTASKSKQDAKLCKLRVKIFRDRGWGILLNLVVV